MALCGWVNCYETKKIKWIYFSALLIGFAITAKLLAIGSFVIFLLLTILVLMKEKNSFIQIVKSIFLYSFLAFLIPSPWFLFSYVHTGNPVYPFFQTYPVGHSLQLLN